MRNSSSLTSFHLKDIMKDKVKNKEPLLRSKDAAHLLDCSPDDVVLLARKGKLRAVKRGRFWRFSQADVIALKKRNEAKKPAGK